MERVDVYIDLDMHLYVQMLLFDDLGI